MTLDDGNFYELIETWPGESEAVFPDKLRFLFEPHRYKVTYGGRGGAKSWSMAAALVIRGAQEPIRWLCARETMSSLKESVHQMLEDSIKRIGLPGYHVGETEIWNDNGTVFTFAGLKNNVLTIKSYEGADGVWVEEAANVSKASWDVLIPTIRKRGSEIWVSFNPILATNDTYRRFVLNPPPDCVVVKIGWEDNPWFNDTMRADMEHMRTTDPDNFDHIWGGECRTAVEGAIFGAEVKIADKDGRITSVPFNRAHPVHTVWDLGFKDRNAIWFVQAYGGYFNFVDYIEDKGKTIHDYLVMLQERSARHGYVYGIDWLPHDGVDALIHHNLTSNPSMSPELLMRAAGRNVRIVLKLSVLSRINAGRTVFPICRFDREKCNRGLEALRMYQWRPAGETRMPTGAVVRIEPKEPLHDEFSHGADAFTEAAVCIQEEAPEPKPSRVRSERPYEAQEYNPFA